MTCRRRRRTLLNSMQTILDGKKAEITVTTPDGILIESHAFDTNQEMADVAMTYWGAPVNMRVTPIAMSPLPGLDTDSECAILKE